ncbi:MAG: SIR2 family protein [Methanomicrobia archaeon]|nr:SIR2 family protein [Methanomicrobia archaeon]
MEDNIQSSRVIFFLGAGASVAAGVPDTYSFVEEFRESISDAAKKESINQIIETLEEWKGSEIDIELLLETLTKLERKDEEPLTSFFKEDKFALSDLTLIEPLIKDLKDFIKSKAIVSEESIKYLEPILGFLEEPLDIISVNYDTCIEQFCNVYRRVYQDGFELEWNPKTFAKEHTDIRLYKLHGSVMWYQSDKAGYVKVPIRTMESEIELITREKAINLMLYPMQKWDYAEPLLELLVEIKHRLESETCKFLVIVGYSFRDEHIRRLLWDAARKNKKLTCILIDPKAYQIYSNKLKYYDDASKIPSSLYERVVCLPYKFEKVFPSVKNYYLLNLQNGLGRYDSLRQQETIEGKKIDWIACIPELVNAEHCEIVEHLLDRINVTKFERNLELNLNLLLKMFVNYSASNQTEKAAEYFQKFISFLQTIFVERLDLEVSREPRFPSILWNCIPTDSGRSYHDTNQIKIFIENLFDFCNERVEWVQESSDDFWKVNETLNSLNIYLEEFVDETKDFGAYITLRTKEIADVVGDVEEFRKKYQGKALASNEEQNELRSKIVNIEKNILTGILGE